MLKESTDTLHSNTTADYGREKVGHVGVSGQIISAMSAPSIGSENTPPYADELLQGNNRTGMGRVKVATEHLRGMDELYPNRSRLIIDAQPWQDDLAVNLWRRNYHNGSVVAVDERAGSEAGFKSSFRTLLNVCGTKHPSEVTILDIYNFFETRPDISKETQRLYQKQIKAMFVGMRSLGLIPLTCTPDADMKIIKAKRGTPRPLSMEDIDILVNQSRKPLGYWFALGAFAGMRAAEIAAIRGDHLEKDGQGNFVIRIPNGKGGTNLTVPCTEYLRKMIQSFDTPGRLWIVTPSHFCRLAGDEMVRLGVKAKGRDPRGISFHSTRHTYATQMLKASNKDWDLVRQALRHTNIATTQIYAFSDNSETLNIAEGAFSGFKFS